MPPRALRTAFLSAVITNVCAALFSLLRTRAVAHFAGLSDLGLLSQALQLQLVLTVVGVLALWGPMVRQLSRSSDKDHQHEIFGTAIRLQFFAVAAAEILTFLFWPLISKLVFNLPAEQTQNALWFILISLPLVVLVNGVMLAPLNWRNKFSVQQLLVGASAALSALIVVPLVYQFGLNGAYVTLVIYALAIALFYTYELWRGGDLNLVFFGTWSRARAGELLHEGKIFFIYYAAQSFVPLLIRQTVIARGGGLAANGLLQAPFAVSALTYPIWSGFLWGKVFSNLAGAPEHFEAWRKPIHRLLSMHIAMVFVLALFGELTITLLLGHQFSQTGSWLFPRLFSDSFRILVLAQGIRFLANEKPWYFLGIEMAALGLWLLMTWWLVPAHGANAVNWTALFAYGAVALGLELKMGREGWMPAKMKFPLMAAWVGSMVWMFFTFGIA